MNDMDLIQEFYNINQLLDEYYENDVPFNINSFINTLHELDGVDIDKEHISKVCFNYEENEYERDKMYMIISFSLYDKFVDIMIEMGRISFEAVYVDRIRNDDVKIINKN